MSKELLAMGARQSSAKTRTAERTHDAVAGARDRAAIASRAWLVASLCAGVIAGCDSHLGDAPAITAVDPNVGYNATPTPVTVRGSGFFLRYDVDLQESTDVRPGDAFGGFIGTTPLEAVTWVSAEALTATVPDRLSPGVYDVSIVTPRGGRAILPEAFTVTDTALFTVASVDPTEAVAGSALSVTVTGTGFDPQAVLVVDDGTDEVVVTPSAVSATVLSATLVADLAPGTYDIVVRNPDGAQAVLAAAWTLRAPAVLEATLTPHPESVTVGDSFALRLLISNTGGSAALAVTPTAPAPTAGAGEAVLQTGPTPASVDIAAGTQQQLEWTFLAVADGDITFTCNATATNDISGQATTLPDTTSTPVTVTLPQSLTASVIASPAVIRTNQELTVTMTVQNHSANPVTSVWPDTLQLSSPELATRTGAPSTRVDLDSGGQTTFTWTYLAVDAGMITVGGVARAHDAVLDAQVGSNEAVSDAVTIMQGAALSVDTLVLSPDPVSAGQQVTLAYEVRNSGDVDALEVTLLAATPVGASAQPVGDPSPASVTIPAQDARSFTWTYVTTSTGSLSFSGSATGTDALSDVEVNAPAATSNTIAVQEPADLSATPTLSETVITEGQSVTLTLSVFNGGGVAADNVLPTALTPSVAISGPLTGPSPTSIASLPPGETGTFEWVYQSMAGDSGYLSFTGSATATDVNSDATVSAPAASSPILAVQTPPSLALSVEAPSVVALEQQGVLVRVEVVNNGQAAAAITLASDAAVRVTEDESGYTVTRTDTVDRVTGGGGSRTLTFAVDVLDTAVLGGPHTIDAQVAARDVNSNDPVSVLFGDLSTSTGAWTVSDTTTPADLTLDLAIVSPSGAVDGVVSTGQTFQVEATVQNAGTCAVLDDGTVTFAVGATGATAQGSEVHTLRVGTPIVLDFTAPGTSHGAADLTASITAPTDACSSATATVSGSSASVSLQTVTAASLVLSASIVGPGGATDGVVSTGQAFDLRAQVDNGGEAAILGDAALTVSRGSTGVDLLVPATWTVPFALETPVDFRFEAPDIATAPTALTVAISAVPLDENTGEAAAIAGGVSAEFIVVQTVVASQLTATLTASPNPAFDGEPVTVVMTVDNTGEADAIVTPPGTLTVTGSASASHVDGPSPASATLTGGGSETFTWHYTVLASAPGTLGFEGVATWVDGNDASLGGSAPSDCTVDATNIRSWYQDLDGDGLGNNAVRVDQESRPEGYVLDNSDCDDGLAECTVDCAINTDADIPAVVDCVEVACGSNPTDPDDTCFVANGSPGDTLRELVEAANDTAGRQHILLAYSASPGNKITFDSNDDACVSLRGRKGTVVWVANDNAFEVKDNDCVFEDLVIHGGTPSAEDGPQHLMLIQGTGCVVRNSELVDFEKAAIKVDGRDDAQIVGNTIRGGYGDTGDDRAGVLLKSAPANVLLADNLIVDNTMDGVQLFDGPSGAVLDHNTIANNGGDAIEVGKQPAALLCMRNNLLVGNVGAALNARKPVTFDEDGGATTPCTAPLAGAPSAPEYRNATYGNTGGLYLEECPNATCPPAGAFFAYVDVDPGFDADYCVSAAELIDGATDLGYDLNGEADGDLEGLAPDIGAQESGAGACLP